MFFLKTYFLVFIVFNYCEYLVIIVNVHGCRSFSRTIATSSKVPKGIYLYKPNTITAFSLFILFLSSACTYSVTQIFINYINVFLKYQQQLNYIVTNSYFDVLFHNS